MCVRHVDDSFVSHEYLLDIIELPGLTAREISKALLCVLEETVGIDRLVAQSYDGASVMSGSAGGVQALVSSSVGRKVIYVHCFAHRLHLVVLKVLQTSSHVTWLLDTCQQLYNFFRRYSVAREYSEVGGRTLKRIMEQRWSGHHDSLSTVLVEFHNIVQTLNAIATTRTPEAIEAAGLENQLKHEDFLPVLRETKEILDMLMPLNMAFQSEKVDIASGLIMIDEVRSHLSELVCKLQEQDEDGGDGDVDEQHACGLQTVEVAATSYGSDATGNSVVAEPTASRRSSRITLRPKRLDDYVVDLEMKRLNQLFDQRSELSQDEDVDKPTEKTSPSNTECFSAKKLKLMLVQSVLSELEHRFGTSQRAVYIAAASLASNNFSVETLEPLVKAAQDAGVHIDCDMLSHEIPIARAVLSREETSHTHHSVLAACASRLHPPSHPNLLLLYRFAMTMAMDTAEAERSFSTVKRILSDYRRSMTHERLRHLTVLSHEKRVLKTLSVEDFLSAFKRRSRRLLI